MNVSQTVPCGTLLAEVELSLLDALGPRSEWEKGREAVVLRE